MPDQPEVTPVATAACDAARDLPLQRGKRYVLACIRRPGHKGKHLDPLSNLRMEQPMTRVDPATIKPEDCPEPYWHETHRYCPACSYAEPPCGAQHPTRGGVICDGYRDHTEPHAAKIEWAL